MAETAEAEPEDDLLLQYRTRRVKRRLEVSEEEQQREAPYVSRPSPQVRNAIQDAFNRDLKLMDVTRRPEALSCDFHIVVDNRTKGTKDERYVVTICKRPCCTCSNFSKNRTCNHISFIMLRVLKLRDDDPRVWQEALLTSEVKQLLNTLEAKLPSCTAQAESALLKKFNIQKQQKVEKGGQRAIEGDCPVCYNVMEAWGDPVVFCATCGNNVHKECFEMWSRSKASSGGKVTCIYCRSIWKKQA